ncbi:MAG TPA: long-chain fatty acid--CoA ligase [Spirochaetota bacterium]|nr:long-chain fatty acid--CoA ligase [Spirochaetota bacterium]HPI90522.1 long-chain fatty acid--CoA ligase [Spirochaetota bacterium]HPR47878.1 long-chain fatty acid--CoA ligase [Spirochaetota bacterium]
MENFSEKSIPAVFHNRVKKYGNKACVACKKDGAYVDISWNEMGDMAGKIGQYLISEGVKKDDRVAIFSPNRYEWWVADQAILSIGATDVPIYATNSSDEAEYILDHSEAKLCFAATKSHLDRVLKAAVNLPKLRKIITFDECEAKDERIITFSKALEKGAASGQSKEFGSRLEAVSMDDLATIIYTSGTTGNPKGVMLTHKNFYANVKQLGEAYSKLFQEHNPEEYILLSILPLSHAFERTCGYYFPMDVGAKVAFAEDFSSVVKNMVEVRPHVVITVPRLFEKIHSGVTAGIAKSSPVKKMIANFALNGGKKNVPYVSDKRKPGGFTAWHINMAEKLVFSKLKKALGMDRIIFTSSGGGPLGVNDAEFFVGMGIPITDGYGLTETSPVISTNRLGMLKPGSVGPAMADTDIIISDEGEIQVKGPQVMSGYYKDEKETRNAFTADGYFKTGDIGMFDDRKRLHITGRLKDIIVTSGGKNISPQNIESDLKSSPFVEQVAVIGDRRKYLSALIVPAFDTLKQWALSKNINFTSNEELISSDEVVDLYRSTIDKKMEKYSRAEQIRKFKILDAEWTQETGELTPTLKVKRRVIEEKYIAEIESLYSGADEN